MRVIDRGLRLSYRLGHDAGARTILVRPFHFLHVLFHRTLRLWDARFCERIPKRSRARKIIYRQADGQRAKAEKITRRTISPSFCKLNLGEIVDVPGALCFAQECANGSASSIPVIPRIIVHVHSNEFACEVRVHVTRIS